jgi:hypothetical protein
MSGAGLHDLFALWCVAGVVFIVSTVSQKPVCTCCMPSLPPTHPHTHTHTQPGIPAVDAIEMHVALMNFTGSVHPNLVDNVNQVCVCVMSPSFVGLAG